MTKDQMRLVIEKELFEHLGFKNNPPHSLLNYLSEIQQQACAWQLLEEVVDPSVEPYIAANRLRREIEDLREKLNDTF